MARFAPHQVDTKDKKTRKFEQGLKLWLYNRLFVLQIKSFVTILEKIIIAEGGSEAPMKFHKEQKNSGGTKGEGVVGVITRGSGITITLEVSMETQRKRQRCARLVIRTTWVRV